MNGILLTSTGIPARSYSTRHLAVDPIEFHFPCAFLIVSSHVVTHLNVLNYDSHVLNVIGRDSRREETCEKRGNVSAKLHADAFKSNTLGFAMYRSSRQRLREQRGENGGRIATAGRRRIVQCHRRKSKARTLTGNRVPKHPETITRSPAPSARPECTHGALYGLRLGSEAP